MSARIRGLHALTSLNTRLETIAFTGLCLATVTAVNFICFTACIVLGPSGHFCHYSAVLTLLFVHLPTDF